MITSSFTRHHQSVTLGRDLKIRETDGPTDGRSRLYATKKNMKKYRLDSRSIRPVLLLLLLLLLQLKIRRVIRENIHGSAGGREIARKHFGEAS